MGDNNYYLCRICLKSDEINFDNILYRKFMNEIGFVNIPEQVPLCLWCREAIKKSTMLISVARKSHKFLTSHNLTPTDFSTHAIKGIYELTYSRNISVNIPPNETNTIDKDAIITNSAEHNSNTEVCCITLNNMNKEQDSIADYSEETIDYHEEEKESNLNKDNRQNDGNYKITKLNNKQQYDYEEMKFDVEYLNLEQQLADIEKKRKSEKYSKMKYKCQSCGIGFLTMDVFKEHELRHKETGGPNKCIVCNLRFKSQDVLSQHSLAHRRKFTCRICSNTYKRWSHCVAHRYKCGGIVEYVACDTCKKIFGDKHSLNIHVNGVHKKERKYHCSECDRRFSSKQRLTVHLRSHTGSKPFSCGQCFRKFSTNSALKSHLFTHTEDKQFYCVECDTRYKTKKGLRRHFMESARHVVNESIVFTCPDCTKKFSTKKLLETHINISHMNTYRCDLCNKMFSNNTNLRKHIRCIHTVV